MTSREDPWTSPRQWWRVSLFQKGGVRSGRGLSDLAYTVQECWMKGWGFRVEFYDEEPNFVSRDVASGLTDGKVDE